MACQTGPQAKANVVADGLITLLMPAVRKVDQASDRAEQLQRNLRVAFAPGAYHREQGGYPKTLDALAPKYLQRVPDDIFSSKALIYRVGKKGYLFYSIGANGIDEGGRWYDDMPAGDDPRVIMPLPPPHKQ